MTEEEKKEFEEFLQWKKEKEEKEKVAKQSVSSDVNEVPTPPDSEHKESEDSFTTIPEPQNKSSKGLPTIFVVVAIVVLFILLAFFTQQSQKTKTEDSVSVESAVEVPEVQPSKRIWDFKIEKDPMTDTKNIWANIQSDNYISQDFPYEGYTYAFITVRYMKKYGYNVLVQISKGQINGSSYNGTDYITARFDGGSPKKYYFDDAADGSSEIVFLRNSSDFISKCKKAKEIKIDIPIYKSGRPVFTFNVDEPLVWREE